MPKTKKEEAKMAVFRVEKTGDYTIMRRLDVILSKKAEYASL